MTCLLWYFCTHNDFYTILAVLVLFKYSVRSKFWVKMFHIIISHKEDIISLQWPWNWFNISVWDCNVICFLLCTSLCVEAILLCENVKHDLFHSHAPVNSQQESLCKGGTGKIQRLYETMKWDVFLHYTWPVYISSIYKWSVHIYEVIMFVLSKNKTRLVRNKQLLEH